MYVYVPWSVLTLIAPVRIALFPTVFLWSVSHLAARGIMGVVFLLWDLFRTNVRCIFAFLVYVCIHVKSIGVCLFYFAFVLHYYFTFVYVHENVFALCWIGREAEHNSILSEKSVWANTVPATCRCIISDRRRSKEICGVSWTCYTRLRLWYGTVQTFLI